MVAAAVQTGRIPNKKIAVPSVGWVTTISPAMQLGLTPIMVGADTETFGMDLDQLEAVCERDRPDAVIFVQVLGVPHYKERLLELREKYGFILLEDACAALGAAYADGSMVGTIGDMSTFSFYFGHQLSTIEGGMVCTNDDKIYDYIKMFRSHGMTREASQETKDFYSEKYPDLNPLFTFAVPGYNMRSCELNAVVGLSQIKRLDSNIERRVENLETWLNHLNSKRYFVEYNTKGNSNFSLPLILREPDKNKFEAVCDLLEKENIEFRKGTAGGGNQSRQPYLEKHKYRINGKLVNADHIHDYGLYIGNHTEVEKEQIKSLCRKLNEV